MLQGVKQEVKQEVKQWVFSENTTENLPTCSDRLDQKSSVLAREKQCINRNVLDQSSTFERVMASTCTRQEFGKNYVLSGVRLVGVGFLNFHHLASTNEVNKKYIRTTNSVLRPSWKRVNSLCEKCHEDPDCSACSACVGCWHQWYGKWLDKCTEFLQNSLYGIFRRCRSEIHILASR